MSDCDMERPVTIIASIDNAHTRAAANLRAEGNVKPDGSDDLWDPESVDSDQAERDINHVFLFVYKKGETEPHKVFFYHTGATSPLNAAAQAETKKMEINTSGSNTSLQMNLELFPGQYNFVLLVNSEAALNEMNTNRMINHPEELVEENTILTSDDLKGADRHYLPMIGQQELNVPGGRVGSEANRLALVPDIKLERVHARVEFILTTANESGTEYLSPILPLSKVTSLTLENEQKIYTVMPSVVDFTATGKGLSNPIKAVPLTTKTPMTARLSFHHGTGTSGKMEKFKGRLLPYDSTNPAEKKYIYVAPSTLASSQNECLTLDFRVRFLTDTEDTIYKIPLTNVGTNLTEQKKYETRRNTIYRINAKLIGRDLSVLNYEVITWINQDVDIPW